MGNKDKHANGDHLWRARPFNFKHLALAAGYVALVIFLVVGCGGGQPSPPSAETPEPPMQGPVEVAMRGSQFQPAEITIAAGRTVVWTNHDSLPHTVTAGPRGNPSGLFDAQVEPGGEFSFTFAEPGSYEYYCSIHPGMDGSVVVE